MFLKRFWFYLREGRFSRVLTLEEASAYVARCCLLGWALGISRFYFYSWDSEVGGLAEEDGKTLKPPATADREIESWLVGARMISCFSDPRGAWTSELERAGYRGWMVWNLGHRIPHPIPEAWPVDQSRDLPGNWRGLSPHAVISIGPSPILFESRTP